jgi:hypothetical protein
MKTPIIALFVLLSVLSITTAHAEDPPPFITAWGDSGAATGQFHYPYGVAVDVSGNVYVTDSNNHRIQKFDNDGVFITTWGDSGSAAGQFSLPYKPAVDLSGFVYIADLSNNRIQKFNSGGAFVTEWGSFGTTDSLFVGPFGVDVFGTDVFVSDGWNRVQKFNNAGIFAQSWGSAGSGPGQFNSPYDVAVSPTGKVYVVDLSNHRIQRFDLNGTYQTEWSVIGPYGIGTDTHGDVYVTRIDTLTSQSQVVKYDSIGTVLTSWGTNGTGNGEFLGVFDVAIDANDDVFVVDIGNHRIQKFGLLPNPDLTVSVSSVLGTSECSSSLSVTATVTNLGTPTAGAFAVALRVSPDSTITGSDSLLASVAFDSLPGGADSTIVLAGFYDGPTGNLYLGVTADDQNTVVEGDETNNEIVGAFQYAPPLINTVIDVPGDEGGFVYLSWFASYYDAAATGGSITEYTLWRAISTVPSMIAGEWTEVGASDEIPHEIGSVMRLSNAADPYFWELVDVQPAYYLPQYAKTLPTLFDSTAVNSDYHYFQIIAHTSFPLSFLVSCVDSARSVDNLAPAQPQNLIANQSAAEELTLTWDDNTELDLSNYAVYRSTDPGFTPGAGNRIGEPTTSALTDGSWTWDSGFNYKVTAVDIHGNESVVASTGPGTVTAIPEAPPATTYLGVNHPNPFNPTTTIRFGLERTNFVTLTVYDATGRVVRRLVSENLGAQHHAVSWDGRNDAGTSVASGIYFYRLDTGSFSQTRKMVLLK